MRIVLTWLRLELRRRWPSLTVLALLVALATATVLTSAAGARRGQTAFDRLWAVTQPATATVLLNQPGFDWAKVQRLPEVTALTKFPVSFGFSIRGYPNTSPNWVPADRQLTQTIERPIVLRGRLLNLNRTDEVDVTPQFAGLYHKAPGDFLTIQLATPQQIDAGFDGTSGTPKGPRIRVRIVGVVRSLWLSVDVDGPGAYGGVQASPALFTRYRANIMGAHNQVYVNALVRLKGGVAALPAFRADLARVTGSNDIDVWNNDEYFGDPIRRVTEYEAAWLLAFGLAALAAAIFLVGQSLARYVSTTAGDLEVLQAVGMTRGQAVASASAGPALAALAGATLGVAAAAVASQWMPIGLASYTEPSPGLSMDWAILGPGWLLALLLVVGGSAAVAATTVTARHRHVNPRPSVVAAAATGASLPVPVVIGARFALEPGRGRSAVPVRPAVLGAITGVIGVLAAFTVSAGVADAATHPERFGQTWQLETFLGFNGQDFGPARRVLRAVAGDPDVTGVDNALIAGAQSGQVSVESFTYNPVGAKRPAVVLTSGRMPTTGDEIVLAPVTASDLHASTGSVIRLSGSGPEVPVRVTGIGFVPAGPHNNYSDGGWLTPAGYSRLFNGAHFAYKFHIATVTLRPGANVAAAARRLDAIAARVPGGSGFTFSPPTASGEVQAIEDLKVLPLILSGFLGVLAVGAVGYALTTAVRRRRGDLAILRALGMTRRQARLVLTTQASLLAVGGLLFGIPLGFALGRVVWRAVASFTPMAYHSPVVLGVVLVIGPGAVVVANLLAVWPQRVAGRLHAGEILRVE